MRKPGPPRDIPPPLELECLKALWKLGEANVKEVRNVLAANRNLAYTTVMTVLDRLARKGAAARRKVGRSFVYAPVLSRDSIRRLAVKELVECFFDGSQQELLDYLKDQAVTSESFEAEAYVEDGRLDTALL
jgi:predicted transcriptional regulator